MICDECHEDRMPAALIDPPGRSLCAACYEEELYWVYGIDDDEDDAWGAA